MTKHWDGPTPYDLVNRDTGKLIRSVQGTHQAEGYCAAMNSPEVKAMYEVLKSLRSASGKDVADTLPAALAAYEAGLKESHDY